MKEYKFTAHIEFDSDSDLYIAYIPGIPGAYTQAASLDELNKNLEEVTSLILEELSIQEIESLQTSFIGTHEVRIAL